MSKNTSIKSVSINSLKICDEFTGLFRKNEFVLDKLTESMKKNGFDETKPIIVWNNKIVDGYHRFHAAKNAGLDEVYVIENDFADENEAIDFSISTQLHRKNLKDIDYLYLVDQLNFLKEKGRKCSFMVSNKKKGKSSEILAEKIGISATKVERIRSILKHEEIKNEVLKNEISISKAYNKIRDLKNKNKKNPKEKDESTGFVSFKDYFKPKQCDTIRNFIKGEKVEPQKLIAQLKACLEKLESHSNEPEVEQSEVESENSIAA